MHPRDTAYLLGPDAAKAVDDVLRGDGLRGAVPGVCKPVAHGAAVIVDLDAHADCVHAVCGLAVVPGCKARYIDEPQGVTVCVACGLAADLLDDVVAVAGGAANDLPHDLDAALRAADLAHPRLSQPFQARSMASRASWSGLPGALSASEISRGPASPTTLVSTICR